MGNKIIQNSISKISETKAENLFRSFYGPSVGM